MSLILDISLRQQQLTAGLLAPGATVQFYDSISPDWLELNKTVIEILALIERNCLLRDLSQGGMQELKRNGRALFDGVIPPKIKTRLEEENVSDLTLLIAQELVYIPWELMFDGKEFLCLRFNTGRCVKTDNPLSRKADPTRQPPARMLIVGDPQGDLPSARLEASVIRQTLSRNPDFVVATKTKKVLIRYLKKNIRDCDILHYAGHADFDARHSQENGWKMADGIITSRDFAALGEGAGLPQLIFMNACQSASSVTPNGRREIETGLFGLANTFLMAGSRYVIGTLARVPDGAAAQMARFFYEHFSSQEHVGRALREARQDLLELKGENDLTWAGYVLYGRPDGGIFSDPSSEIAAVTSLPLSVHKARRFANIILYGFLACVVLGAFFFFRQSALRSRAMNDRKAGIAFYKQGDYVLAKERLQRSLVYVQDSKLPELYELMANTALLSGSSQEANLWLDKAAQLIEHQGDPGKLARITFLKAENILQAHWSAMLSGDQASAQKYSLADALKNYETARSLSIQKKDRVLEASIIGAIATVYRLQGNWPYALSHDQNAVAIWEEQKELSHSQRLALLETYLDLAWEYIEHPLDFSQAAACLTKFDLLAASLNGSPASYRETVAILRRNFEFFLRRLARKGYKNSDLYKKAGVIYDRFVQLKMAQ